MRGWAVWCGGYSSPARFWRLCVTTQIGPICQTPWGRTGSFVLTACLAMPSSARKTVLRQWNYEHFQFTFDPEACLSDGVFGTLNGVNQIDFGPLSEECWPIQSFFSSLMPLTRPWNVIMRFNSAVNWYTGTGTPAADQFDWWSVATHEMGHCLGLAHEDSINPPPVMRSALPMGTVRRQLTPDDVAGRNSIYGTSQASASGGGGGGGGGVASWGATAPTPHPWGSAGEYVAACHGPGGRACLDAMALREPYNRAALSRRIQPLVPLSS